MFRHYLRNIRQLEELERIRFVESDCWIGYSRAAEAMSKLNSLYNHPSRQRMPNLLIIGPTNNGKSMIIENFLRRHPPKRRTDEVGNENVLVELPVLSIQMPSSPDLKRFFLALANKLDLGRFYASSRPTYIENELYCVLVKRKVKMIIIDEIHNILAGSNKQQLELRIPLVCVYAFGNCV